MKIKTESGYTNKRIASDKCAICGIGIKKYVAPIFLGYYHLGKGSRFASNHEPQPSILNKW